MGGTGATGVAMSPEQQAYFERLEADAGRILAIAKKARQAGLDPSLNVEIPLAPDLAARVEEQVQIKGVAQRVRELSKLHSSRELVALHCAKEVAAGKFGAWPSKEQALDKAVRTGLSILTEGILVAPLEGIAKVLIGKNNDNTDYVDLYFAGPIRAAGGTAQAMSVLIADVVRRDLGVGRYVATQAEIERYKEEVPAYKRAQHLQYAPEGEEIEHIVRQCPVCINGEGTEQEEVTGHRDLPRVEGNRLRGGAVLVLAEGLTQKAPKIMKVVSALKVPEWDFLERFIKKAPEQSKEKPDEIEEIEASDKFIKELIGGRPVFSHPSRAGGFRLRYGRSRTGGLASTSISPVAMHVVDDFLAIGSQMKLERPGKGTICTPCSELEPPILLLRNGDLVQPATIEQWRGLASPVAQIVDLGEILIPFGEFLENNALLPDASFTLEWWLAELRAAAGDDVARPWLLRRPDFSEAVQLAHTHKIPLHPDHNLFWHDLGWDEYTALSLALESATFDHGILCIPKGLGVKTTLVTLGVLHRETPTHYEVRERAHALLAGLGLAADGENLRPTSQRDPVLASPASKQPVLNAVSRLTGVTVKARAPTRIGARMGRPEKADKRAMSPPVHVLFPIGQDGGSQRDIEAAAEKGTTRVKVGIRRCPSCGREAYMVRCTCGARTEPTGSPPQERDFPVREEFTQALGRLRGVRRPDKLKGVEGLISAPKTPEPLEKGILRALHDVWVFKDGTLRFDATDAPITHVRPAEIHTSVARLRELGYTHDTHGGVLERTDQVIELRIQDVVLPRSAGEYFVRAAQYVDDLLERFYGLPPFYLVKEPADLVGHLVAGLAPHTSGAVLGRVIGFTKANVGYAHPFYHAAKRRNCVAGATELFVFNSPAPVRTSFEDLWKNTPGAARVVDAWGTEEKIPHDLRVHSINPRTGRIEPKRILKVLRTHAPKHVVEVVTKSGRRLTCTPEHALLLAGSRATMRRHAIGTKRAPLALAASIPHDPVAASPVDLAALLIENGSSWAVLRGLRDWGTSWIRRHGGIRASAARLAVPKKSLDNFRRRDSFPARIVGAMLHLEGSAASSLPETVRVAAKHDAGSLPRFIHWSPEFLRFVGYYLAEGHARSRPGSLFQVGIAATEKQIRDDVEACAAVVFETKPHTSATALTFSGRVLHFLITEHLRLGQRASEKRIPTAILSLPTDSAREVLRAYFSGDGSASSKVAQVSCTSVSKGLLADLGLLLAREGISYTLRTEHRSAGGKVKEFLIRKGRPSRTFESHTLRIFSEDAKRFATRIGFFLDRKQRAVEDGCKNVGHSRRKASIGDLACDPVVDVRPVLAPTSFVYDIEVEDHHTFLLSHGVASYNCDGDEDAFMLLLDAFLNFSRAFVPDRRGGLMDLPLVLATRIDPSEIDKEALNVDVGWSYPLELYRASEQHLSAKEVAKKIDTVGARIGTPRQFEGFGFTLDSGSIHEGPLDSSYKTLGSMPDKMAAQLELADKLRGVDAADVAARVISHHLLPDLIGNLKAFAKQSVRCTKCNTKYRRMPVSGKCTKLLANGRDMCGNAVSLTVHQASVRKYLDLCLQLSVKYKIPDYTKEHIRLVQQFIDDTFRLRDMKLAAFG